MKPKATNINGRRDFIGTSSAFLAGFTIVPSHVIPGSGHITPGDKLTVACTGIGGRGGAVPENVAKKREYCCFL